jgi:hypothetical protein
LPQWPLASDKILIARQVSRAHSSLILELSRIPCHPIYINQRSLNNDDELINSLTDHAFDAEKFGWDTMSFGRSNDDHFRSKNDNALL